MRSWLSTTPIILRPAQILSNGRLFRAIAIVTCSSSRSFARMLAQGTLRHPAELAELGHVSRPRGCQILLLTNLAPAIQEAVLFLPKTVSGRDRQNTDCAASRACWTGTRKCGPFVLCWPPQHADDSEFQAIDALALTRKRAHWAALFRQIA